ncbi:hypothetical protein [Pseudoblastomonas halimionae]|uniref:Uncharacterized protein n=1 Tax=Alteriqipengyuania halimionae TaxID=1926630 RepID=A0A6I4U5Y2_9SPHN|nr:hypothetical protein [Alteriqipengyuania halimionae]MXP10794.1 hypothetical protein [Alteriqipengyuania halimionae]
MEEKRRPTSFDDFAHIVREASRARVEILKGVARVRVAMASKLRELRAREVEADLLSRHLSRHLSNGTKRRKPPEAGMPMPAIPPKGPLPMQGGAEAPLDFGD